MPLRVNPIILLGLIIALILSLGVFASALLGGGATGADALGVGMGQLGKPFQEASDGPNSFSCTGLMRYILRTIGVDGNAPWVPEAYLSTYAPADLGNLQPGDIVIFPGWATMYAGDGNILAANEGLGKVAVVPMSEGGTPLGAVRPYGGSQQPLDNMTDPSVPAQGGLTDPLAAPVDTVNDTLTDPMGTVNDTLTDPLGTATDTLPDQTGTLTDTLAAPVDPTTDTTAQQASDVADPTMPLTDQVGTATDPLAPPPSDGMQQPTQF